MNRMALRRAGERKKRYQRFLIVSVPYEPLALAS